MSVTEEESVLLYLDPLLCPRSQKSSESCNEARGSRPAFISVTTSDVLAREAKYRQRLNPRCASSEALKQTQERGGA